MEEKKSRRAEMLFAVLGLTAVVVILLSLLTINMAKSNQSSLPLFPDVYFRGQYRVGQGQWLPVTEGKHIPATRGPVTLQGQFYMVSPSGEELGPAGQGTQLALYAAHIHITVQEQGQPPYAMGIESETAGEDLCGEQVLPYVLRTSEPLQLTITNRHRFGNENAVDMFLQELSVYGGTVYEKSVTARGDSQRNMGLFACVIAFTLLGTALFSSMLHISGSAKLWLIGFSVLSAGVYHMYSAHGVFFRSESVVGNTTILGAAMMLYMLFVCSLAVSFLTGARRRAGVVCVGVLGLGCGSMALSALLSQVFFFDTWLFWAALQSLVWLALSVCMVLELLQKDRTKRLLLASGLLLPLGFWVDVLATARGWWHGGFVSGILFCVLALAALLLVWQIIPRRINDARRTREVEAEQKLLRAQLQENRVAIMISQIQPHFIYNTLGTIHQLCKEDPQQAAQLVQNFSLYLRGNFSELDSTRPIRFDKELQHVRYYTQIELVRFPDMTVRYDIRTEDFLLPALTVQPLVENAIKHGLMGLEQGGTVTVKAFETDTHFCVTVSDDGVGFDARQSFDEKKHIGIRNVRERLQAICGGTLTLESQPGRGTVATVEVPKEGKL